VSHFFLSHPLLQLLPMSMKSAFTLLSPAAPLLRPWHRSTSRAYHAVCRSRSSPQSPVLGLRTAKQHQPRKFSAMTQNQEAHQYQAGATTHKKEDEWKHREPYRIHDKAEDFEVKWEGQCHCGRVQYELSRDKPLAAKYCHCTTCQRLHGVSAQKRCQTAPSSSRSW
jgi:hypothetical protein